MLLQRSSSGEGSLSRGQSSASGYSNWTFDEQKTFEVALATHYDKLDRMELIAACLPGKTLEEVQSYYLSLEDDVRRIDSGEFILPSYVCQLAPPPPPHSSHHRRANDNSLKGPSPKKNKVEHVANNGTEKRKGVPWTEEEHKLFLLGLAKFGKGDWRSIARNFVVSRTPTQVASHAQKYFIRLNSVNKKDKRRASIHDITCASLSDIQHMSPDYGQMMEQAA